MIVYVILQNTRSYGTIGIIVVVISDALMRNRNELLLSIYLLTPGTIRALLAHKISILLYSILLHQNNLSTSNHKLIIYLEIPTSHKHSANLYITTIDAIPCCLSPLRVIKNHHPQLQHHS